MKRVVFVCLGNFCRSPLAQGVFEAHLARLGRSDAFVVDSAGTSGHHQGEPPHAESQRVANRHGIQIGQQRSRPFRPAEVEQWDHVIAMDRENAAFLSDLGVPAERVILLRQFDPEADSPDIPDPWYGGPADYQSVYYMLERCIPGLLSHLDAAR